MKSTATYRAAVFLSSFLLFMVEPMVSKTILPVFGGSFMVWGACMVFFQAVLLAGYVYAHVVSRFWGNAYARWHWMLLLTALLLPLAGFGSVRDALPGIHPFWGVLLLLTQSVGWPAFILSATSPLLQRWFSDTDLPGKDNPYALFAASNAGSLAGLLGYPVMMEPLFELGRQFQLWWMAIGALVVLQLICGQLVPRSSRAITNNQRTDTEPRTRLAWFLLGAAPCALFMATTNVITMDIAPAPLLWVLPLAVYLTAFIVAFKDHPWRPTWMPHVFPWGALLAILLCILSQLHFSLLPLPFVALHLLLLFATCWICATQLADLKPVNHANLTGYYLLMGLGGLLGGAGVAWLAPLVSTELAEFPFSYALTGLALAVAMRVHLFAGTEAGAPPVEESNSDGGSDWRAAGLRRQHFRCEYASTNIATTVISDQTVTTNPWRPRLMFAAWIFCVPAGLLLVPWLISGHMKSGSALQPLGLALVALPVALALRATAAAPLRLSLLLVLAALLLPWTGRLADGGHHATRLRNFYGIYRVFDQEGQRLLQHGSTLHGRQYLTGAAAQIPAGYYHPSTPAGLLLSTYGPQLQNIGMIGLGTGALAWYGHTGTCFKVFELDPDGVTLAENEFTYLQQARQKGVQVSLQLGDGRLSLRNEANHTFDLLVVDAFNSGSIPTHLLTCEAFTEYMRVIRPEGILLLHVSNRNLDLQPVVAANAKKLRLRVASKSNSGSVDPAAETSEWMAITRSHERTMDQLVTRMAWQEWNDAAALPRPWTDSYSNILGAFSKW